MAQSPWLCLLLMSELMKECVIEQVEILISSQRCEPPGTAPLLAGSERENRSLEGQYGNLGRRLESELAHGAAKMAGRREEADVGAAAQNGHGHDSRGWEGENDHCGQGMGSVYVCVSRDEEEMEIVLELSYPPTADVGTKLADSTLVPALAKSTAALDASISTLGKSCVV